MHKHYWVDFVIIDLILSRTKMTLVCADSNYSTICIKLFEILSIKQLIPALTSNHSSSCKEVSNLLDPLMFFLNNLRNLRCIYFVECKKSIRPNHADLRHIAFLSFFFNLCLPPGFGLLRGQYPVPVHFAGAVWTRTQSALEGLWYYGRDWFQYLPSRQIPPVHYVSQYGPLLLKDANAWRVRILHRSSFRTLTCR